VFRMITVQSYGHHGQILQREDAETPLGAPIQTGRAVDAKNNLESGRVDADRGCADRFCGNDCGGSSRTLLEDRASRHPVRREGTKRVAFEIEPSQRGKSREDTRADLGTMETGERKQVYPLGSIDDRGRAQTNGDRGRLTETDRALAARKTLPGTFGDDRNTADGSDPCSCAITNIIRGITQQESKERKP